jgi:hypothetical protein
MPEVLMTPRTRTASVGLGQLHTRHFELEAPPEVSAKWKHEARGAAALKPEFATKEDGSYFSIRPRVVGTKIVRTTGDFRGPHVAGRTDPVNVAYETPRPVVIVEKMDGVSARGVVPVLKSMQSDEELVITGMVRGPQDEPAPAGQAVGEEGAQAELKAVFSDTALAIDHVGSHGGRFTVKLRPQSDGTRHVQGQLRILPYEARARDIDPATIDLAIQHSPGGDEFGEGRAYDIEGGVARLRGSIHEVYDKQITSLEAFEIQREEVDPPPKTPLWESLLDEFVSTAIGGVTAGLGVKLADWAMHHGKRLLGSSSEAWHEVIKSFSEQNLNHFISISRVSGGNPRGMRASFHKLQKDVLTKMKNTGTEDILNRAKYVAERDEKQEGRLGIRHLLELAEEWSSSGDDAANRQFGESFQAWSTLLARNATAEAPSPGGEGGKPTTPSKLRGTDLSHVVPNLTGKGHEGVYMADLQRVPGVLYLDIVPYYDDPEQEDQDPKRFHSKNPAGFDIKGAHLGGFPNQTIREEVKQHSIGSLRMPIVAAYDRPIGLRPFKFTVARNEANEIFATESSPGILQMMTGITDPNGAGAQIMNRLAIQTVAKIDGDPGFR